MSEHDFGALSEPGFSSTLLGEDSSQAAVLGRRAAAPGSESTSFGLRVRILREPGWTAAVREGDTPDE